MISLLTSISVWIINLPMFPWFDIAHDFLAAVDVRNSLEKDFASRNFHCAMFSLVCTIANIYAGSMMANFIMGEQVFAAFWGTKLLILAFFVWLAVFFSPYDFVYRLGETLPVRLVANILKEIYRAKKVRNAIFLMSPRSTWVITKIVIAIVRGNGAGVAKQIYYITQKVLPPNSSIPSIETSLSTKSCFVASVAYLMKLKVDVIPLSHELLHLSIVLFFIFGKVSTLLAPFDFETIAGNWKKNKTVEEKEKAAKQTTEKKKN